MTSSKDKIWGYHDFFPYSSYRPTQERAIQQMSESVLLNKNVILIASNGTGKTIMALSAVLPIAIKQKRRKILFCSRTFSQNARVIQESKEISRKFANTNMDEYLGALSLKGRNEMCVHKTIERLHLPPHESMSVCASLRRNKKCKYFNAILKKKKQLEKEIQNLAQVPMDAQDVMDYAESRGMCPYFLSKIILKHVDIVVCNYQWIFEPNIRKNFLENLEISLEDCIIIMDEAHNLPEMANGINSFKITPSSLRQARKDLDLYRAKKELIRFVKSLGDLIENAKNRLTEEMELDIHIFLNQIMNQNKLGSISELNDLIKDLEEYGEAIADEKINEGKTNRDFVGVIVDFFTNFLDHMEDTEYFPCMTVRNGPKGKTVALELKCMDPRGITNPVFKESYATISLSGTLHPFTFTQLLGLNSTGKKLKILKLPPPFPKKNLGTYIIDRVNTRGENRVSSMYRDILIGLKPILEETPKNVGIFCASYEVVNGLWDNGFDRLAKLCKKKVFREESGLRASDNDIIIEQFKDAVHDTKYNGGVLLGVCGGRNSEGEDFPGNYMNTVVVVGIPFQRPTPALNAKTAYYENLFPGKGKIFSYIVPAFQRSNQACGRPIRRMQD